MSESVRMSTTDPPAGNNNVRRGYASVNGLRMYCEVHGTTHVTLIHRADWLVSMVEGFLDAPTPEMNG